ncbi:hypothetical protein GC101_23335 [Paenibacillus sp. LMG 31459]|uniref:YARHG domain-containing protein n=1 Tax=Paenibacillus phytohabitans TaxID=2654978 RepID=A0ABX1YQ95_9BACL|nr:hypothetical protein [Paenibacillus phytohabitans]NOU81799.1 hypothetical protein [Paenibacillus phytohabitans]
MRIISLLLALMVIAGCSETGSNESAEPPEASVTSEAAAQSTAPQASPADATADFTGEVPEVSPEISDKYSGFLHMDAVQLNGQIYEVYYWNKGEFTYTQFAVVKDGKIVFDSKQAGIKIEGGNIWSEEDDLWAEALVQNNHATFLFSLMDNRPESSYIVVEEIDGVMQVTVNDNVSVNYEDTDQDGDEDLLASPFSGQLPLGPALVGVYELQGTRYVPDKTLTKQYAEDQLRLSEQEYKNNPTDLTLDSLLSAYLILEQRSFALTRFEEFYEWAGQRAGDGGFVDEYYDRLKKNETPEYFSGWMDKLEPLRTER